MGQTKLPATRSAPFTLILDRPLKFLTGRQIQQIDEALSSVGSFAEVRLIKNRGKLRFIQKLESESMHMPQETMERGTG
jgi:hypothetical protein